MRRDKLDNLMFVVRGPRAGSLGSAPDDLCLILVDDQQPGATVNGFIQRWPVDFIGR
jgi:hypothetical protein